MDTRFGRGARLPPLKKRQKRLPAPKSVLDLGDPCVQATRYFSNLRQNGTNCKMVFRKSLKHEIRQWWVASRCGRSIGQLFAGNCWTRGVAIALTTK
eukprot:1129546-Pleurochrysis_carterae.AAC.1